MSMDATLERMQRFREDLSTFVEQLQRSGADELAAEQRLWGRWDDDFQRTFRKRYEELAEPVDGFVVEAQERFLPFLDVRIHAIREYLNDGR